VRGLLLTDASTFPTSTGVNPMLTIMSIAHMAAQYIKTVV
jgi:choline dehydrogenase-like flavoprotein